ncbi:L,D-transpeptidase family protein [Thermodesulforhabdus norvegica]|uniref:L,D-transpeptidase catalytic domain n=1 Tax=Thermodesulforhabdus norvegica TaxID=39841 RepID=A0A1I4WCW1_9BACT|nr:L,D-transpeptidase [Thermodesulforhabdus norvegica]SFN11086.1 L,D-transpeptidase catalytic domain [Thermodesulforhabdus norvegica]
MPFRLGFVVRVLIIGLLSHSLAGCSFLVDDSSKKASNRQQVSGKSTIRIRDRVVKVDYLRPLGAIKDPRIVIVKSKRRLYLYDGDVLVREYPVALGKNPQGHKTKEGDGKTPEGRYLICKKNGNSKFYKSLGINYPLPSDAEKAFIEGRISEEQYKAIVMAHNLGLPPPWDTPLGGAIFIHGGGAHEDWTDGCVALYNSDMDEVFAVSKIGTPVFIYP